jgi:hypothetical protein
MQDKFIKDTVTKILEKENYAVTSWDRSPRKFIEDWHNAAHALFLLAGRGYEINILQAYDGDYSVSITRYSTEEDVMMDYAFAFDKSLSRAILEVLVRANADE